MDYYGYDREAYGRYLAHKGKKGSKWGYTKGKRNGKRTAQEIADAAGEEYIAKLKAEKEKKDKEYGIDRSNYTDMDELIKNGKKLAKVDKGRSMFYEYKGKTYLLNDVKSNGIHYKRGNHTIVVSDGKQLKDVNRGTISDGKTKVTYVAEGKITQAKRSMSVKRDEASDKITKFSKDLEKKDKARTKAVKKAVKKSVKNTRKTIESAKNDAADKIKKAKNDAADSIKKTSKKISNKTVSVSSPSPKKSYSYKGKQYKLVGVEENGAHYKKGNHTVVVSQHGISKTRNMGTYRQGKKAVTYIAEGKDAQRKRKIEKVTKSINKTTKKISKSAKVKSKEVAAKAEKGKKKVLKWLEKKGLYTSEASVSNKIVTTSTKKKKKK